MKKRISFILTILTLIPSGQVFLLKKGAVFSTTAISILHFAEVNAESASFYFERGIKKQNELNYRDAIRDFTKAIELYPNYFEAFFNRGFSKGALDDIEEAIKDLTKAIELNSEYAEAYI